MAPFKKNIPHRTIVHGSADERAKVYRVLLTGGPCAGKTTSLAKMQTSLGDKGFRVYCVPEAATLMMKGGAQLNTNHLSWDF